MTKKQLNEIRKRREELNALTNEQVLTKLEELEARLDAGDDEATREFNQYREQVFLRYGREVLEAHTEYCETLEAEGKKDISVKAFIALKGY